jgi:hypothetical protein
VNFQSVLEQLQELLNRETGMLDDAFERAAFEVFAVKRNRDNSRAGGMTKEPMRAGAVVENKARALQNPNHATGLQTGRRGMEAIC